MRRLSAGLLGRVALIVLTVVVPSAAIIAYDQRTERHRAHDEAIENTARLARLAVSEQSRIFSGVQRLLETIALFPGIRDGQAAGCAELLPKVLREHPNYINIFVVKADGSPFCTASELPGWETNRRSTASAWFTRAVQARKTIIGDYQLSLKNGQPSVVLAKPVIDDDGRVQRVVAAVIGLDEMNRTFQNVKLPHGATLTLTDRHGIVLARTPDPGSWIGRTHAQFVETGPSAGATADMHESVGSDGVRRVYTILPVDNEIARDLFVTLDIESAAVFADADRMLAGHLWLLGLLTLGALGVALLGGNFLVLQPLRARERAAEERMRFALEVSKIGVWEHHGTDGKVFWTDTLAAMHGISLRDFGGDVGGFLACVHPDEREDIQRAIGAAIAARQPTLTVEYTSIWPDGTEHKLTTTAHYSYDEAGELLRGAGVTVDVTEQRSLEEQLRQSQKMEAIGRLAGGVAHDFNNMLTAILGNAEFLADSLTPGDERRTDVQEITHAAARAATLTQQLLAFSRKQILKPTVLYLGEVIVQTAPMLRRLLGETIDLQTTAAERHPVRADAGQIAQVVMNLAVNARDAMKAGGRLSLETTDITVTAADVRHDPSMSPGDYVLLRVTDTGHGMDAATAKRIFEPFFTTKGPGQGTGLGLSTVYGIVQQSGGHIGVTSEPGSGTTFNICLPRTAASIPAEAAPPPRSSPRGSESVLVVEDEQMVREFATKVLQRLGYSVHAVESAEDGIRYARSRSTSAIDLILTDVVLPGLSGPAMTDEMARHGITPAVVYMSGYTDDVRIRDGAIHGDRLFLPKPFTRDSLAEIVRRALDGVPVA